MKTPIKQVSLIFSLFFIGTQSFPASTTRQLYVAIRTIPEAVAQLGKVIQNIPKDAAALPAYEKEQSALMLRCAKMLYDAVRMQLLDTLSEIDMRIAYWQYQKDHPWNYFVSKNPLKWITGPKQEDEIEDNLETLKSHQGHVYTMLGQLAEQEMGFKRGYKDTFLTNYQQGYAWIDALLAMPIRIKTAKIIPGDTFEARVQRLQSQLAGVLRLKDDLLSDIIGTEVPSYIERNWLKSSAVLFGLGYGYNNIALHQITGVLDNVGHSVRENIVIPVEDVIKDVFIGNRTDAAAGVEVAREGIKQFVNRLDTTGSFAFAKDLSVEDKAAVVKDIAAGKYGSFQALSAQLWSQPSKIHKAVEAKELLGELEIYSLKKQFVGLGKLALLTPAVLAAGFAYFGYKRLGEKNYAPLRRALVDINTLFVDPSKPLTDEETGKAIYLIYMLKKRATKELPEKRNIRADFIADLERIESSEFSVAAKRAIIDDMFKKYDFLGLIQKK